MNRCKKTSKIFFAFVVLLLGVCFLSPKAKTALASDSSTFKYEQLSIADYTVVDGDTITRTAPKPSANLGEEYKDWIFAGWYTDANCTKTVVKTVKTGTYYAKYVPSEVLSAKCQVSAETTDTSPTSQLRIVSTVDSLKYSKVGFDIVFNNKTIQYSTSKVFSKIEAATDGVAYGFSPNIFDLQSEYFITATLINIKNENFDEGFLIKPYWVTKDGTKVYGVSRYARVEDSYLGIVNVPVRLYSDNQVASGTATVAYDASKLEYLDTYTSTLVDGNTSTSGFDNGYIFESVNVSNSVTGEKGTLTVSASPNENVNTDGMLVNLRLKKKSDVSLPKINEFEVSTSLKDANSQAVAIVAPNVIYMNYVMGAYSGEADTSWYDSSKSAFVITTPEELFGLASLSKNNAFANKTIYVGADINVHSNWTASSTEPTYPWSMVGSSSVTFAGIFDGQGHTISGLYVNDIDKSSYVGMFAQVAGTVKDFSIKNSYFSSNGNMFGSIVGFLTGNMEGIYSNATVVNTDVTNTGNERDTGGLVGRFGSGNQGTISNCWFDGSVTSNNRKLGGIVGRVANGQKSIKHCLNTGIVQTQLTEVTAAQAGGVVGTIEAQAAGTTFTIEDCLNTGDIKNVNNRSVVGSVIGIVNGTNSPSVTIANTYATSESYSSAVGVNQATLKGSAEVCSEELLTGYTGYLKSNLDFYTTINKKDGGYWVVNADSTPTLLSFSDRWADVGWYFDDDDITTYEISTVEELYGLAALSQYYDFKGETIKLTKDITLNEGDADNWGTAAPKYTWTPINASKTLPFMGTFDGQGHTVSGVYINKTGATGSEAFVGLFGATAGEATIKNLRLENSYVYGAGYFVGSIAGRGNGTFKSVYSDATVISDSGVVGGIAGQVNETTSMMNCWFTGRVNQSNTGSDVGGLVGTTSGVLTLTVENCLNTGAISGATEVGGFVGRVRGANEGTLIATNSMNLGTISSNEAPGNILGEKVGTAKIANCYGLNSYSIIGVGTGTEWSNATYTKEAIQGEGAFAMKGLDFTGYWVAKDGSTPELKSFASSKGMLTPSGMQVYTGWYNSWDSEYTITTSAGLYGLSELSQNTNCNNFLNKTVKLGADICINELEDGQTAKDLKNKAYVNTWSPIGTGNVLWGGTFDGQGHTIRGLYVNNVVSSGASSYAGLFGQTTGRSTIRNFRLVDSYIYGSGYIVGGIAGRGNGLFDSIYSNAIVESDVTVVGGFIGQVNSEATITNCWYDGEVKASSEVGGFVGATSGIVTLEIENCLNSKKVNGSSLAGGFVGQVRSEGTLFATNNLNVGIFSTPNNSGNIVGKNSGTATIVNSYGLDDYVIGQGTITNFNNATYSRSNIQGKAAFEMKGLDFTNYWVAKEGATPELRSFASKDGNLKTQATQVYTGWYQGKAGTYILVTAAGLRGLSELSNTNNFAGSVIKLGADITLNEGELEPKGKEEDWNKVIADWDEMTPIGTGTWFNGTFDGQGYTIRGLYVSDDKGATENSQVGLFAKVNTLAKIQNVKLEDSYIQGGGYYVGSIVGQSNGAQYTNVYSDAIVKGNTAMVGGLVGAVQSGGGAFTNCWYNGAMKLTDSGCQAGGLIGVVRNDSCTVTIDKCLNSADVYSARTGGDHWIGGLVGALRIGTPNVIITSSLNAGSITIADNPKGVGALVGHVDAGTLGMNHTVYGVKGEWDTLGTQNTSVSVTNTANLVDETSLIGDSAITNAPELFADGTTWKAVIGGTPVLSVFAEEVKVVADTSWYNANKKTFTIKNASELYGLSKLSKITDFKGKTIKLGANITTNVGEAEDWASEAPLNHWTPINNFAGTFDGQGHTISGLYVKSSGKVGFFSITTNATIKNLQLKNCYIHTTASWAGSVVGQSKGGTFDTIYADTIVQGDSSVVGGIIGDIVETVVVDNCWFNGTVNPSGSVQDAAGIVGRVDGEAHITDCLNTGTIQANSNSGGIVGRVCSGKTLVVSNSVNTGSFGNGNNVGAILGHNNTGTAKVASCYCINDYILVGNGTVSEYNNSALGIGAMQGDAAFSMTGLDFTDDWIAKTGTTPELRSFTSEDGNKTVPPTQVYIGWYNTWDSEYTITTKAGFYGMATLESTTNQYSGKTVKLGADIVMNEGTLDPKGNSSEWQTTIANWDKWTPIDLKGTFDGQGHEISGLYVNYSANGAGIFNDTYDGSMVKDLRLVDSYITGTGDHVGSIAGWGYGSCESIYSDAIVVASSGKNYVGGLVGTNKSGTIDKMSNCWFDGTIVASGGYVGGLLGYVNDGTTFAIQNCLFTGMLKNTATTAKDNGGLCGNVHSNSTLNITNCLMAGTLDINAGSSTGKVVGNCGGTAIVTGVYSLASDYADAGTGNVTGTIASCTREQLTGDAAKTSAPELFYDGTYWKTTKDLPVLGDSATYEVEDSETTLMNIPLSRYKIVVSESASTLTELLAEYLQKNISDKTGVTIEVVNDSADATNYEIVLGNTERDISGELYKDGTYVDAEYSYAIKSVNSCIQIGYSDSPALVDAFDELLKAVSNDDITEFDLKHKYDTTDIEKAESSYVRVMSSNVYSSKDTSAQQSKIPYQARAELLAECYLRYKPDFIGWQEADQAMRDEVYKYIAHEYQMVEFEMSADNWCPIFYRKDLYNLETADYFIMNAMHYCEWAVYSSKSNLEQQFIHMNIHYDVNEEISLSQAVSVNKTIKKLMAQYPDAPIAVTGDYNFTATESVFKTMMRGIDDKMQSSSQILNNEDSKYYTWHVLGELTLSETYGTPVKQSGPIDHVSITTNLLEAKEYKIIHDPLTCWAADHYPIFADLVRK